MTTNLQFINDALSLINVLPEGQDASAEQGDVALRTTNELVDEWSEGDVVVNWSPQTSLTDDCSLSGMESTAVKYHLAIRLCPHFGRDPSATLIALANSTYAKLLRKQMASRVEPVELSLPQAEGGLGYGFDITSGGF
jgi:hypothetical protein